MTCPLRVRILKELSPPADLCATRPSITQLRCRRPTHVIPLDVTLGPQALRELLATRHAELMEVLRASILR